MSLILDNYSVNIKKSQPGIQMTLFDYFMDSDQFTLNEAVEIIKQNKDVKEPSIRGRIYEGIEKGLFERIGKGVYTVKKITSSGNENTCLLCYGDGRDLSMVPDDSIDCIITDHPYKLEKSLKGGNRNFATYETFQYVQKDMDEKFRVMKKGCFLVEFLPEENGESYKYIYKVKEMAEKAGFEYYACVPWKKGNFVSNTGRKAKNTEQVVMFTKGRARELRIDAKKEKEYDLTHQFLHFEKEGHNSFSNNNNICKIEPIKLELSVKKSDYDNICIELEKAWNNWVYDECKNSILINDKFSPYELCKKSINEYLLLWLEHLKYEYRNLYIEDTHIYMSGANGMLPVNFDIKPVEKNQKIHQAEKPVELLENIIDFVSKPNETILDQFGGSGVIGEASLNTNRNCVMFEKDKDTYERAVERISNLKNR